MQTTTLSVEGQKSGDAGFDMLLEAARKESGRNWQINVVRTVDKRLFREDRIFVYYELMVEVGGVFPYQVINCASGTDLENTKRYLLGYLSGLNDRP